jgi:hypothetical protein
MHITNRGVPWKLAQVQDQVILLPTVSRPVRLGAGLPSGAHDQIFNTVGHLRSSCCWAPSRTIGRVYNLLEQFTVTVRSKFRRTHDHILMWYLRLLGSFFLSPLRCTLREVCSLDITSAWTQGRTRLKPFLYCCVLLFAVTWFGFSRNVCLQNHSIAMDVSSATRILILRPHDTQYINVFCCHYWNTNACGTVIWRRWWLWP